MLDAGWKRSSFCESGACAEVKSWPHVGAVMIRDSEEPGAAVIFSQATWKALVAGIKAGEFDE